MTHYQGLLFLGKEPLTALGHVGDGFPGARQDNADRASLELHQTKGQGLFVLFVGPAEDDLRRGHLERAFERGAEERLFLGRHGQRSA